MTADSVAERLRKAERRAHPDVGELAGARADVSFWARFSKWGKLAL